MVRGGQKGERKYGESTQHNAVVKRVAEGARKYRESTQQGEAVKGGGEAYRQKCSRSAAEV
jgi:outer membrane protein assembly factor BamD (BamD/ComL family)